MIFINSYRKSKILSESVYREIIIKFPDAADGELQEIGSENIIQDSFELTRSICDENEFTLGGCIAGQMTVQVVNIEEELNGKNIQVYINQRVNTENLYPEDTLYPDDTLYPGMQSEVISQTLFTGKINSSLRQKNRAVKEIIAYDALYEASNILAYNYFLNAAKYSPNQKIGDMVEAVLGYIGLSDDAGHLSNVKLNPNWEEKLSLSYEIAESVCNDKMTVLDLLQALCELNAAWGYINRNGKFLCRNFIKSDTEIIDYYADLEFEEFEQQDINMLQFTYNQNKTYKYGSSNKKSWYISDNIIAKCCSDISAIVKNFHQSGGTNYLFNDVYKYRPFSADVFARWWLEPGDRISIKTGYDDTETVESIILSQTIKGINGMRVTLNANGVEYLGKEDLSE